jgi:ubiquinone/menaquinone biosynthesis C-methylase UbiE
VLGVDIAAAEVRHARARAKSRGLHHASFEVADLAKVPIADASVDVPATQRTQPASPRSPPR